MSVHLYILLSLSLILLIDKQRLAKTLHVSPNSIPEIRLEVKFQLPHASSSAQCLEGSSKNRPIKNFKYN